jgi:hypothetical protein
MMFKHQLLNRWTLRGFIGFVAMGVLILSGWGGAQLFVDIPFETDWANSGHADATAEAFVHWDMDDPPEIPTSCAKCHSTWGYLDFLGADSTDAGTVDNAAPIGTTVECIACHNQETAEMDSVVFPSGVEVTGLGDEARCMQCHQGRASSNSVDSAIANANVPDADTASESLRFINIHYYAAAATRWGGIAKGGYQYEGKAYDAKFAHVEDLDTCHGCHDPHSLKIKIDTCSVCHSEVENHQGLKDIRLMGSASDYDGDGDVSEGIYYEIKSLQEILYDAMQAYAVAKGAPILYSPLAYPYFFKDTNGNGAVDEGETSYENQYNAWTARLLKAAYNYQVSKKDPGGFAHGGKYIIQLLYDSIEDLDPILVEGLHRNDSGHFAGSEKAFRHWDEDGKVPGSCSKCHSATGLPFTLEEGVSVSQPLSNGLLCSTCHDSLTEFTRYTVDEVKFPSGAVLSFGEGEGSNLCINCHQGRESTVSVNAAVAGFDPDVISTSLRFRNIHYFAAGATLFGTEAKGAYEYEGKTYNGRFYHVGNLRSCAECHDGHTGEIQTSVCRICHPGIDRPEEIRKNSLGDYDGDGDSQEGIAGEIETLRETLYSAIQTYAVNVAGIPIVYDSHSYPYFFFDTNGNGLVDAGEASYGNRYNYFTPRLLKAAYNYQYSVKDTGAFAHNGKYVMQILHDSLEDLGASTAGMVRP